MPQQAQPPQVPLSPPEPRPLASAQPVPSQPQPDAQSPALPVACWQSPEQALVPQCLLPAWAAERSAAEPMAQPPQEPQPPEQPKPQPVPQSPPLPSRLLRVNLLHGKGSDAPRLQNARRKGSPLPPAASPEEPPLRLPQPACAPKSPSARRLASKPSTGRTSASSRPRVCSRSCSGLRP